MRRKVFLQKHRFSPLMKVSPSISPLVETRIFVLSERDSKRQKRLKLYLGRMLPWCLTCDITSPFLMNSPQQQSTT